MIHLESRQNARFGLNMILILAVALVLFSKTTWAQQGILDFERFKQEIEPLLSTTTYNSPSANTTCLSCHGDTSNQAYLEYPLVLGQSRDNFLETARQIELDNPAISPVLLKPLALAGGGVNHGLIANNGGEQFTNTSAAAYQTIINWIEDATRSSIGANVSKSVPHPNPFRFSTDIVYFLTTTANKVDVILFTMDGREIQKFEGTTQVGANLVTWDGRDKDAEPLPTGVYFYAIKAQFPSGTVIHNGSVVYTP